MSNSLNRIILPLTCTVLIVAALIFIVSMANAASSGPEVREWNKWVWGALFFLPILFYLLLAVFVIT